MIWRRKVLVALVVRLVDGMMDHLEALFLVLVIPRALGHEKLPKNRKTTGLAVVWVWGYCTDFSCESVAFFFSSSTSSRGNSVFSAISSGE